VGGDLPLPKEAALFRAICQPLAGQQWLDVGTSAGFYAGVLAGQGVQVLATDLSPAMLKVAARQHPSPLISYALTNGETSLLPTGRFDGVSIGATLGETGDWRAMLRESVRLLRPGGWLWLMYLGPGAGLLGHWLARVGGLQDQTPGEIEAAIPEAQTQYLRVQGRVTLHALRLTS
jgi:ubiquinone/menaquinone biosynthesis C-methylase UbiE